MNSKELITELIKDHTLVEITLIAPSDVLYYIGWFEDIQDDYVVFKPTHDIKIREATGFEAHGGIELRDRMYIFNGGPLEIGYIVVINEEADK